MVVAKQFLSSMILVLAVVGAESSLNAAESKMWVASDTLNRRTCPSTNCGVVGKLFFREGAIILERKSGWGRITKYYDASCKNGRSEYVDNGQALCSPKNGIKNGKFAEWVKLSFLTISRPDDPAKNAAGNEKLVAQSDDYKRYKSQFLKAATSLISAGSCNPQDFIDNGGWVKSSNRGASIYFTYCAKGTKRIYLDVKTQRIF